MLTMNPTQSYMPATAAAVAALVGAATPATAQTTPAPTQSRQLSDTQISDALHNDLYFNWNIDSNRIDMAVTDGVVTLQGQVRTLLAKRRAVETAHAIRGVRSVIDRLTVQATDRPDSKIRSDARAAIRNNPATESYDVTIQASSGNVTISGNVESMTEKWLAEDIISSIDGVRSINNSTTVSVPAARPDNEILQDVRARISRDVRVDALPIQATVTNGEVTLTGSAGSAAERMNAIRLAWVDGARSVNADDLSITFVMGDGNQKSVPASPNFTDDEVSQAVMDALYYDPRVNRFDVTVRTLDGQVTLLGKVPTLGASMAAEKDARNTAGVFGVTNLIAIRPDSWALDDPLAAAARDAIERDALLDPDEIKVSASDGVVTLTGTVNSLYEMQHASDVVGDVVGVTMVLNRIDSAQDWTWKPDAEIAENVRDQLFWSPFVDSDDIVVAVDDGVATLTGTASNFNEMSAARENAREGGARAVRLDLTLEP